MDYRVSILEHTSTLEEAISFFHQGNVDEALALLRSIGGIENFDFTLLPDEESATLYCRFLTLHLLISVRKNDVPAAKKVVELLTEIIPHCKDDEVVFKALSATGGLYLLNQDTVSGLKVFTEALELAQQLKNPHYEAMMLGNIAIMHLNLDNIQEALLRLQQAQSIFEALESHFDIAKVKVNIANLYFHLNDYQSSLEYSLAALPVVQQSENFYGYATLLGNIGSAYQYLGETELAIESHKAALDIAQLHDYKGLVASSLSNIASIYFKNKMYDLSLENYLASLHCCEQTDNATRKGNILYNLGVLYSDENFAGFDIHTSEKYLLEALDAYQANNAKRGIAHCYQALMELYEFAKDWEQAFLYSRKLYEIEQEMQKQEAQNLLAKYDFDTKLKVITKEKEVVEKYSAELEEKNEQINEQAALISKQNTLLEERLEELNNLVSFKDMMTATIVHDFKNPLNTILNVSEMEGEPQEHLLTAKRVAQRLLALTLNLLDVQKFQFTQIKLDISDIDMSALLLNVVKEAQHYLSEKHLNCIRVVKVTSMYQADERLLERVLENLLTNAIKYSPIGAEIILTVSEKDEKLYFSVQDKGIGIPKDKIAHIFDLYSKADEGRSLGKNASTGIGLAFCKLAVEAHSGSIEVTSEVGKGSTFTFCIPAVAVEKSHSVTLPAVETTENSENFPNIFEYHDSLIADIKDSVRAADLQVYQYSDIVELLERYDFVTQEQQQWRDLLLQCVITGDEEAFNKILSDT